VFTSHVSPAVGAEVIKTSSFFANRALTNNVKISGYFLVHPFASFHRPHIDRRWDGYERAFTHALFSNWEIISTLLFCDTAYRIIAIII
jgi:hypothetical protein